MHPSKQGEKLVEGEMEVCLNVKKGLTHKVAFEQIFEAAACCAGMFHEE